MNRERAKELLPILQAYAEGKTIQCRHKSVSKLDCWSDVTKQSAFPSNNYEYRIKPEEGLENKPTEEKKEPVYRPFKDCDELIKTFCNKWSERTGVMETDLNDICMPLIWVVNKINGCRELIIGYGGSAVLLPKVALDMRELLNDWTFLDGSPCGVREE